MCIDFGFSFYNTCVDQELTFLLPILMILNERYGQQHVYKLYKDKIFDPNS